jgi:TonB family protein
MQAPSSGGPLRANPCFEPSTELEDNNAQLEVAVTDVRKRWEGQTVNGEFHLGTYLAGSPHSAVFLTHIDDRESQTAVIKLVGETLPDSENQLTSWQVASTLSHPNLIQVFQTGRWQIDLAMLLYVVMEYADEDLSRVVPCRPLTESEAREMLNPVLDAVAYLHAKGLVHGRIKPSNIMASCDQLKLSTDGLRRAGEQIWDPSDYDPPETITSRAGDVWSLGITLVEVLTQRLPVWNRNGQSDPVVPDILPAELLDIARHCLRRDPKLRWTITDIANRLNHPLAAQRTERIVPRNRWLARSVYLIPTVILLVLTGIISLKLLRHPPRGSGDTSQGTETPSAKASPKPREARRVDPSEEKSTELSEKQSSSAASPASVSGPAAQASAVPGVAAATSGVIHQVLPDAPQKSINTIRGTVRVVIAVNVDSSGNVADATIDSPGPSKYFADLALQAARHWEFAPARDASRDWTLRFEFSADGVKAIAAQSSR